MSRPVARAVGVVIGVAVLIGLGISAYSVFGPRATDFAGRSTIQLGDYQEADPSGVPSALTSRDLIVRGEYLTRAADCVACHSTEGGTAYAGGRAFKLPFGTLYSTNITPDKDTGIGAYTDAEFLSAVRQGMGRGHRMP